MADSAGTGRKGVTGMYFFEGKQKVLPLIALEHLSCKDAEWRSGDSFAFSQHVKQSSGGSLPLLLCNINTHCVQEAENFALKASPK